MSISFWYRIRNRCGVQSPPPDIRWARASPGSGSRDCAHLAAPAKRRNHLRKRSEGRPRKLNHRQAPAPGAAASPRRARAVGELGRSGASLGVPAWICTVCIRVCFCLLIQGAVTWITLIFSNVPGTRSPHVPPSVDRPTQSPAGFSEAPNAEKCTQSFKDWHHEQQHG